MCVFPSDHDGVHAYIQRGRTPLIKAVERGHTSIVELLLEHGADPSLRDDVSVDTGVN